MSHRYESPLSATRPYGRTLDKNRDSATPRNDGERACEGAKDKDQNQNSPSSGRLSFPMPPKRPARHPNSAKTDSNRRENAGKPFWRTGPNLHCLTAPVPSDRSVFTVPTSSPSSSRKPSPSSNGASARGVAKIFLDYGDLVAEKANLNFQRDNLERAARERNLEYDKTMQRHPEFQSVPEMQNRFRDKQSRDLKRLEDRRRSHEAQYLQSAETIATQILSGLNLTEIEPRQRHESNAEIASLKTQLKQLSDSVTAQLDPKGPISKTTSQLAEQQLAFRKELDQLRADMRAERATQEQRRQEDLKEQAAKYEDQLKALVQVHSRDTGKVIDAQAQASATLAVLRVDNSKLSSALSSLTDRVQSLVKELAEYKDEIKPLGKALDECSEAANGACATLRNLDLDAIDQMGEVLVSTLPGLQKKVADHDRRLGDVPADFKTSMQHHDSCIHDLAEVTTKLEKVVVSQEQRLDGLTKEVSKKVAEYTEVQKSKQVPVAAANDGTLAKAIDQANLSIQQVKKAQQSMGDLWASMLDDLDVRMTGLATRTNTLEERIPNPPRSSPDVDRIKGTTDQLAQDFTKLTQNVDAVNTKMEQKCEYLNHQFTTLDSQFNNLSTKSLADHIIAQMEVIYPKNEQILSNMDALTKGYQEFMRRVVEISKQQTTLQHAFDEMSNSLRYLNPEAANKKRKVSGDVLGTNGANQDAPATYLGT